MTQAADIKTDPCDVSGNDGGDRAARLEQDPLSRVAQEEPADRLL
ncbi:hypothetical protein [Arthrobacter sp. MW3 TE3886]